MAVFLNVTKEDLGFLLTMGFGTVTPKSEYEAARYSGPCSVILYSSGKLVVQGKDPIIAAIAKQLEDKGAELVRTIEFEDEYGWVIGSDESLKGDTFGGLTVAGVAANEELRNTLRLIGVQDSKIIADADIPSLAQQIRDKLPHSAQSILPFEYNGFTQTALMNGLHAEVKNDLAQHITEKFIHVVDKYPGCTEGDVAVTKAESRYLEVAAASILARDAALSQLRVLGMEAGLVLPKGSTHVKEALLALKEKGLDPRKFVKMHFRNVQAVFSDSRE